jgi:tetratricopeptide (TPR) repeat protein
MRTRDVCLATLLVLAAAGLRGESASPAPNPDQARNLNNLGSMYFARGQYSRAEAVLSQAAAMGEPKSILNLAATLRAEARYPEAEKMYQRAGQTGSALLGLALVYRDMGRYADAEQFAHRALEQGADAASTLNLLGMVAESEGRPAEAKALLRRALGASELPEILINLGNAERQTGDFPNAQAHLERAVNLLNGAKDPSMAAALEGLSLLARARGDLKQAHLLGTRALLLLQASLGADHPEYAAALANLALVYTDLHDARKARGLYLEALRIDELKLGPAHPRLGTDLNNLGVASAELRDYISAESYFRHALEVDSKSVTAAFWMANLANVYAREGKRDDALQLDRNATTILSEANAPGLRVAAILEEYASLLRGAGWYAEAEDAQTRAMRIRVRYAMSQT